MEIRHPRLIIILTVILGVSLAIASYLGAFVPGTYKMEETSFAVQGMGQDFFDLFIVVPVLAVSMVFMLRRNTVAFFVFAGTLFYILYSFFIYSFGVHFNKLFLFYCLILGVSFYVFVLIIYDSSQRIKNWGANEVPVRFIGIYLVVIAVLFYILWLSDVVPSILNDTVPKAIADNNLLVNPVHVIDIALALPGLVITGILVMRKHPIGILFTPVFLVFTILLAMALVAMVVMLELKGMNDDISVAGIFVILAAISTVLLYLFFKDQPQNIE